MCEQASHFRTMKAGKILSLDPESPDQGTINKAAWLLRQGGLVVFPTSTLYGLGAHAFATRAVDRIFQIKRRPPQNPLLILIGHLGDLSPLVKAIPKVATRLIKNCWPGGITLVFEAVHTLPPNLTGHTGKIGIRLPGHPVASALVKAVEGPITGTSANLSGKVGCTAISNLDRQVRDQVDLILDAGTLGGGKGSTVVDVTIDPPRVLREGTLPIEMLRPLFSISSDTA